MTEEPSLRDQLLADYDAHEDMIEDASAEPLWTLGDWLAQYVPNEGRGRPKNASQAPITLDDLAGRRGRSRRWLSDTRKVAEATALDRLGGVAPRVYLEALRNAGWDLAVANKALRAKGPRLRDHSGKQESIEAIREAFDKRSPEERTALLVAIVESDDSLALDEIVVAVRDRIEPARPRAVVGPGPEQYEIDKYVFDVARAMHAARQRLETYSLHNLRPLSDLRDALDQTADDIAVITAAVREAIDRGKSDDQAA